jgi:transcription elongation factor SPT6
MERYREIILEIVNKTGVDLNNIIRNLHRSAPLQFVCGFGPIKAEFFLSLIQRKKIRTIRQRSHLMNFEKECFQEKIFFNAFGFLKIIPPENDFLNLKEYNVLDQTRILMNSIYILEFFFTGRLQIC